MSRFYLVYYLYLLIVKQLVGYGLVVAVVVCEGKSELDEEEYSVTVTTQAIGAATATAAQCN